MDDSILNENTLFCICINVSKKKLRTSHFLTISVAPALKLRKHCNLGQKQLRKRLIFHRVNYYLTIIIRAKGQLLKGGNSLELHFRTEAKNIFISPFHLLQTSPSKNIIPSVKNLQCFRN